MPHDLSHVPLPVAYPLHFARDARLPASDRLTNARVACEQAMRLTGLLLLADYIDPEQAEPRDPRLASVIRGLVSPHWKEWVLLANALASFWTRPERADRAMFGPLAAGWLRVTRGMDSKRLPRDTALDAMAAAFPNDEGRPASSAIEAVWVYRNQAAHRTGTVTPADAQSQAETLARLLPLVEAIVHTLFGLAAFTLFRAIRAPGQPMQVIALDGPHPDLRFAPRIPDPAWETDLAPTDVVAVAGHRSIPVYPLFIPTHDEAGSPLFGLEDPVGLIEQVSERKLVLLGVRGAHNLPRGHAHLDAALAALRRSDVDVALSRRDTAPWSIDGWSRHTAAVTLEELTGRKYFPLFYLERPDVDDAVTRLEQVPGGALLLLGEAGSGKSSLIARLAQRLAVGAEETRDTSGRLVEAEAPIDVVVWLSGRADYAGRRNASSGGLLIAAVARKLGVKADAFVSAADLMLHLRGRRDADQRRDRRIWFLLDAVNEAERFTDIVQEIDALLPELARHDQVRLVVAMRKGAFDALAARDATLLRAGRSVFANADHFLPFPDEEGQDHPWKTVRPFHLQDEGPKAYALRQTALPGSASPAPWSTLDQPTQRLLLRPLYLHLFHLVWASRPDAPTRLGEDGLLDAYLDHLGDGAEGGVEGLRPWLDRLAQVMLERRTPMLPIDVAEAWTDEWLAKGRYASLSRADGLGPVEQLVSATVLLRPVDQGAGAARDRIGYGFTQQKLAERLLVRGLDALLGGTRVPDPAQWQHWLGVAAADPPFPELVGALLPWTRRLAWSGDHASLARILDVDADAARYPLLATAVLATVHMEGGAATALLSGLSDEAGERGDGRDRWFSAVWDLADGAQAYAPTQAIRRIWLALAQSAERDAGNGAGSERNLSVAYSKLGDLALLLNEGGEARSWFQKSMTLLERLAEKDPGSAEAQRDLSVSCERLGDLALRLNDGAGARRWFEKAMEIRKRLAEKDPESAAAQRDLSVSCERLGDLALRLNDGAGARRWFEKAMEIAERLAEKDPESAAAQRDLSVSCIKLGDLALWLNDGAGARRWFEKAMEIRERLAEKDPESAAAQRDLSVSCNRLGDLALRLNDGAGARRWFEKAMEIAERLAEKDPESAEAQRDLSVSCNRLGDLALRLNDGAGARRWFEKAMEIRERLAEKDPESAAAQRDLSVSCNKLGDLALRLNDGAGARRWFEKAMEIRERLAEKDPESAAAQRDLSVSCDRLGDLALRLNDGAGARRWFEKAMEIDERLAEKDPESAAAQRDLFVSCNKLGDLALRLNDGAGARRWFEKAMEIAERLAEKDPESAEAQRDLSVSCDRLGDLALRLNDGAGARRWFEKAMEIDERLAEKDPESAEAQHDLSVSYGRMGVLALRSGDTDAARAWLERQLEINRQLATSDPDNAQAQTGLALSLAQFGQLLATQGDLDGARQHVASAHAITSALLAAEPTNADLARLHEQLAEFRAALDRPGS